MFTDFPLLPERDARNLMPRGRPRKHQTPPRGARAARQEGSPLRQRRPDPSHRFLVVALDNLGDLVFASALTPLLRAHYPTAEITLWCKEYTAGVAALVPGVDRVESAEPFWDRAPGGKRGSVAGFLRSVWRLRREQFDVALLTAAPWRTAAAVAATGATRRIGLARHRNARWLTDVLPEEDVSRSVLQEMSRLLVPLDIEPPEELRYALDAGPLHERRERFRALLGPRPVALHAFASRRGRCVPLKHWIRVAVELQNRGYDPLWVGTEDELREVHRAAGSAAWRYVNKLGEGTLADSAAAISLASLFIGHDSGPLHVAGAFGVPVVGVYTPGQPRRTFPQGIGPSVMLERPSPDGVTSRDILEVVDALPNAPPLRLMR